MGLVTGGDCLRGCLTCSSSDSVRLSEGRLLSIMEESLILLALLVLSELFSALGATLLIEESISEVYGFIVCFSFFWISACSCSCFKNS